MRVQALCLDGTAWGEWEGVDAWLVQGPTLTLSLGRGRAGRLETVTLPPEVIGLVDDAPAQVVATSHATAYRPAPGKDHRPKGEREWARSR